MSAIIRSRTLLLLTVIALFALSLAGCGGGSGPANVVNVTITGVVFDINSNPVRGATVTCQTSSTITNSAGTYVLHGVDGPNPTILASITSGGVRYVGQNLAFSYVGSPTKNVNITVVPERSQAFLIGNVADRAGNIVGGAQVYAVAVQNSGSGGAIYSSVTTLTDGDGNYTLGPIASGVNYEVLSGAQGYDSDNVNETLQPGETRTVDFALKDPSGTTLAPPTNFVATAYTSPAELTRSNDLARAIQDMRRLVDKRYGARHVAGAHTRTTPEGNDTEVDLSWDAVDNPDLLGFGIYRILGTSGPHSSIDFLQDPLANYYADFDASFRVGQRYTYAATSINTLFGQAGGSESTQSNVSTATILGDLDLGTPDSHSVVFNWTAASGATLYAVYLFDRNPDIGVDSIWNNDVSGQQSTGTSQAYTGNATLTKGQTYYYIVVGRNADGSGVTFSRVGSFVKS